MEVGKVFPVSVEFMDLDHASIGELSVLCKFRPWILNLEKVVTTVSSLGDDRGVVHDVGEMLNGGISFAELWTQLKR